MNEAVKVGVSNDTMSILELILQASLLVQIVILLLILASLASWVVIFTVVDAEKSSLGIRQL